MADKKICAIFNIAPAYRRSIYALMEKELSIDIFCGDHSADGIATLPLQGAVLKNKYRGRKLIWQKGALRRAFAKRYENYILTGNAGILSNWIIVLLARLTACRVYLWTHGLKGNESWLERKKNMLYFRLAGNLLVYSERGAKILNDRGFKRTTVIYNSLDYDAQLPMRAKAGDAGFLRNYFGNDLPTLAYLGRLTPFKQIDMLLEAMVGVECNLVIVGGGEIQAELEQKAQELGLADRVWFYGECYDETFLATLLSNVRLVVNPSSIGLTVIHSFMFGTPVVTHSDMDSQMPEAEIIEDGVNGYMFEKNSVEGLRSAIEEGLRYEKPVTECYRAVDEKYNPHNQISILRKLF